MNQEITQAVQILKDGDVVAIPTETVYGLAANVESVQGIKRIFTIKERPFFDPLIVHVNGIEMAKRYAGEWSDIAQTLATKFWPGPLTLVLPKNESLNPMITSGLESVGLRVPKHPIALEIITQIDCGLAAPSANKFKRTSPTRPEHVQDEFGDQVLIVKGGECQVGIESTVVGVFKDKLEIYRPGDITQSEIQKALKDQFPKLKVLSTKSPVAPGQLEEHYRPVIPVFTCPLKELKKILSSYKMTERDIYYWEISTDSQIAARTLYSDMREASKTHKAIWLNSDLIDKNNENWHGIINRLQKASTYFTL
jgi:L-threonylcarbamoyladenylate synthase